MIGCTKLLCGTATIADLLRADAGGKAHLLQFSTANRPIVVWNTTQRCNLACAHCYLDAKDRASREELTTEEGAALVDDVAAMRCPVLLFSGGEPLMRPDVFELGRRAIAKGVRAVLSSNGTLVTPELARRIAEVGFSYVGVSVDGTAATHDQLRRKKGALDAALTGIRNCLAAGVKAGIRFTLNRRNAADLDAVLDLVEQHGVPRFCLYHLVYAGRGREMVNDDLAPAETRRTIEHLLDRTRDWHRRGVETEVLTTDNHADGILIEQRVAAEAPGRLADVRELLVRHGGCSAGTKMANVDARGNVHPCQFWSHVTLGNVRERPFSAIWGDESNGLLAKLRHKAQHLKGPRCSRCRYSDICGGCRIRAEVVQGDPWADDPACFLAEEEIRPA
ncbi:MAG: radical SAM protein [Planctomycetes bacterium]|nr:radical SAM protein [Planctomycetota bacterium]